MWVVKNGAFSQPSSVKRNIWEMFFLVDSSWAVQELQLVMVVETFTCAVLPLKTLPRAAGRASWWLEEGAGRCIEPYGTYTV